MFADKLMDTPDMLLFFDQGDITTWAGSVIQLKSLQAIQCQLPELNKHIYLAITTSANI